MQIDYNGYIYDDAGTITSYVDPATGYVNDLNGNVLTAPNGAPVTYDTAANQYVIGDMGTAGGYGATDTAPSTVSPSAPPPGVASGDWLALFSEAAPKVMTGIQAWQLSQINVERARQGLAPLNAALYAPGQAGFMANMSQQGVMLLVAAGAAILLLGKKGKR